MVIFAVKPPLAVPFAAMSYAFRRYENENQCEGPEEAFFFVFFETNPDVYLSPADTHDVTRIVEISPDVYQE